MSEANAFRDLIARVRAGDAAAAAELVRQYEPTIRMIVRRRLSDPALRRLLDSMDISQSVLASFFLRAAAGQYELDDPQQLLKLLAAMARNKLSKQAARLRAARRDVHRVEPGDPEERQAVDPQPDPSNVVAGRELLDEFRRRLTSEEAAIAEQRAQGQSWVEIAAASGGRPDGVRMRLRRAIERVTRELGLEG
jgi:RNA polymerase sigma-70 factor (ECF subfamily)